MKRIKIAYTIASLISSAPDRLRQSIWSHPFNLIMCRRRITSEKWRVVVDDQIGTVVPFVCLIIAMQADIFSAELAHN